jgi:hypothetical protein
MSLDNPNGIESSVSKNTKQRRTFLIRATAGAAIASIPGRSAWAGIAGSIVASGHGSDFNQGTTTVLLDACGVLSDGISGTFKDYFGRDPIGGSDASVKGILEGTDDPNSDKVNAAILIMLYNASNHGFSGINYPVLSQHNNRPLDFANYLYAQASADPSGVAGLLWSTIGTYGGSSSTCTPP